MNSSHTPGPWSYYLNPLTGKSAIAPSGDWPPLAKVNTESDARLIAAAPELLAALESLLSERYALEEPEQYDGDDNWTSNSPASVAARAAIAKATATPAA